MVRLLLKAFIKFMIELICSTPLLNVISSEDQGYPLPRSQSASPHLTKWDKCYSPKRSCNRHRSAKQ